MRLKDLNENDGSIPFAFVKPSEIIAEMACRCCSCRDLFFASANASRLQNLSV